MQLNALFTCLWGDVDASCHKHFIVFSGSQHCRLLPAMCHNLRDGGRCPPATAFTTSAVAALTQALSGSRARYRLRIAISAYPAYIQHPHWGGGFPSEYCYTVWHGKTRMAWLPNGEKILMICLFVLTKLTNVPDRQTDTA